MRNIIISLLLASASSMAKPPDQQNCKYWIKYFDRISQSERKMKRALKMRDFETADYYRELIRRDIRDVNDDTEELNEH
jgi:hypothetical protein